MGDKQKRVLWWLSFTDSEKPSGSQFLGVSIIDGTEYAELDTTEAFKAVADKSWRVNLNPGGAVRGNPLNDEQEAAMPESYIGRLLTGADVDELNSYLRQKLMH